MFIKGINLLSIFLLFIIFIKVIFIISSLGHLVLSHSQKFSNNSLDTKLVYWKERTEFVFMACMALLLIYYFKPGHIRHIGHETSILFFLFGWILLITAKWELFFEESKWYKDIVFYLQ